MRRLTAALPTFVALLLPLKANAQTISTFAGGGPNNIPANSAGLDTPVGVATDILGNVYFTVRGQNRVFKVDTSGIIRVVAGNGFQGFSGDGGPAASAELSVPSGVAVDSAGNVFIADTLNQRVREVAASTGIITTVAGNGSPCGTSTTPCGDGGPATSAELTGPEGVVVNSFGNLFIADTNNNRIREVAASTGIITTVAGNGTSGFSGDGGPASSAELNFPTGVAVDAAGNFFIADFSNSRIRKVSASTSIITTVAGNGTAGFSGDGGPATSAEFHFPSSVAVDSAGNLFIADGGNGRIREVAASTDIINTVAGNGTFGFSGDGGPATSAGLNGPLGVAVDSGDNFFIGDTNNNRIRKVTASTGIITTFAGNGSTSPSSAVGTFGGDGFEAAGAQLSVPVGAAVDSSGNVFIVDLNNERVREVAASTGIINTVAGNGTCGFSGDGGPATSAELCGPFGPGVDFADNVFIADNQRIREVAALTGVITTIAGNGTGGFGGDGGPATSAQLSVPAGVAVDASGNVFIADTFNDRIREVTASTGIITTVAGNGTFGFSGDGGPATSAELSHPAGVAVDSAGNIFIADTFNSRIREVMASTGIITTVAGNGTNGFSGDGGPATSAELSHPAGVAVDSAGNLFIADSAGNLFGVSDAGNDRIRQVAASTGVISTVAGNGTVGFSGDGGPATSAELNGPTGVAVDSAGNLFIADSSNNRVREVTSGVAAPAASLAPNPVSFGNQPKGTTSAPQTVILSNIGTSNMSVTAIALNGTNAADFAQTNTCGTLPATVAPSASCDINVTFTPSTTAAESASLAITDNATGNPQSDALSGTGTPPPAPAATLSPTSVAFGNEIVRTTSALQVVIVTNSGNANLSITGIAISGANAADFAQTNTCGTFPATVAPSNSCNISVTFTPSTTAAENASLMITDNASNSPQSVPLTGNGIDFGIAIATGTASSATVTAGATATYTLSVSPLGGFSQTINLSCTGAPMAATCTPSPMSVTLDGTNSQNVTVTVTTMARGILPTDMSPREWPWNLIARLLLVCVFALMIVLSLLGARRLRPQTALALLILWIISLAGLEACGGSGGPPPPTGTPAGTYTLTVTGKSGGLSHSATLTLMVN